MHCIFDEVLVLTILFVSLDIFLLVLCSYKRY